VGETTIELPDIPVLQLYVKAPLPESRTELPAQTDALLEARITVGFGRTVISVDVVLEHPELFAPVTE
jgi:hypothetical protein